MGMSGDRVLRRASVTMREQGRGGMVELQG